jgi:hypothetical protein
VFEEVVARCIWAGLVGGEGFAIDASVIEAATSRGRKSRWQADGLAGKAKLTRPVREYLDALDRASAAAAAETADPGSDMPPGNPSAAPRVTSLTDPTAAWTNKGQMKGRLRLRHQLPIDLHRSIIVDVEATPARRALRSLRPRRCWNEPKNASASNHSDWPRTPATDWG